MVHVSSRERRASVRVPGSYSAEITDTRNRLIGRGRTANISEQGVFILLPGGRQPPVNTVVHLLMELPRSPAQPRRTRMVRYSARVLRVEPMGRWIGIALQLCDKLA